MYKRIQGKQPLRHLLVVIGLSIAAAMQAASSSELEQQRTALLLAGEAALSAARTNEAWLAFERAGYMRHAVDAETGLVRAYMQAGQYRRAVSFAAHTSGVHSGDPIGIGLYGWLLYLGGQRMAAEKLLDEACARLPDQAFLKEVRLAIQANVVAPKHTQDGTVRLTPYSEAETALRKAYVAGSGVLIDEGRRAIVPMQTLSKSNLVWLRNGMGQVRKATVEKRMPRDGLAMLRLTSPMPMMADVIYADSDPFPGSVTYVAEYSEDVQPNPAWPALRVGFLGSPIDNTAERTLGVDMPRGPRGGPVFDSNGRLAGITVGGSAKGNRAVLIGRLRSLMKDKLPTMNSESRIHKPSVDQIYETALHTTLQVLQTQ